MSTKSFSKRLRSGESPEALKTHYCLTDDQYLRVILCLEDIHKNGGKK